MEVALRKDVPGKSWPDYHPGAEQLSIKNAALLYGLGIFSDVRKEEPLIDTNKHEYEH